MIEKLQRVGMRNDAASTAARGGIGPPINPRNVLASNASGGFVAADLLDNSFGRVEDHHNPILAIIANICPADFAKSAIDHFAICANYSLMKDLHNEQRRWLSAKLADRGRGAASKLATHLRIRADAISRIVNPDARKETRRISLEELIGMAEFFGEEPPGLRTARAKAAEARGRAEVKITTVPLLDSVPAGKLTSPLSQLPIDEVPLLAFADLGRGDFIALTVQGDSMDRISPDRSTIVINKSERELVSNRPYVFSIRGEVTFKLWKANPPRLEPFSTNPVHEPIYLKSKAEGERFVVGRVKRTVLDL
ncbi:SOS-response transcriptional repressor LexA [Bradyrhizobium yuanmingense]|uniref:S24 family peptidase n=1 Tax=Bradyrhizobium yuanmingense TaxID=108015 RepID=UPI00351613B0